MLFRRQTYLSKSFKRYVKINVTLNSKLFYISFNIYRQSHCKQQRNKKILKPLFSKIINESILHRISVRAITISYTSGAFFARPQRKLAEISRKAIYCPKQYLPLIGGPRTCQHVSVIHPPETSIKFVNLKITTTATLLFYAIYIRYTEC